MECGESIRLKQIPGMFLWTESTCVECVSVCVCVFVYAPDIKPTTNSPRVSLATEIAFLRKKKKFTSSLCTWLTHSVLLDQRCVITGWIEGTI